MIPFKVKEAAKAATARVIESLFKPGQVERHLNRQELATIIQASWEMGYEAGQERGPS